MPAPKCCCIAAIWSMDMHSPSGSENRRLRNSKKKLLLNSHLREPCDFLNMTRSTLCSLKSAATLFGPLQMPEGVQLDRKLLLPCRKNVPLGS
ncbi:MAG: hypothetical protein JWQ42_1599 [Edaphobacter sp.]|nr:hypothetical protein [Edaphobacter sp.]